LPLSHSPSWASPSLNLTSGSFPFRIAAFSAAAFSAEAFSAAALTSASAFAFASCALFASAAAFEMSPKVSHKVSYVTEIPLSTGKMRKQTHCHTLSHTSPDAVTCKM
jgi:hypothetical protein